MKTKAQMNWEVGKERNTLIIKGEAEALLIGVGLSKLERIRQLINEAYNLGKEDTLKEVAKQIKSCKCMCECCAFSEKHESCDDAVLISVDEIKSKLGISEDK